MLSEWTVFVLVPLGYGVISPLSLQPQSQTLPLTFIQKSLVSVFCRLNIICLGVVSCCCCWWWWSFFGALLVGGGGGGGVSPACNSLIFLVLWFETLMNFGIFWVTFTSNVSSLQCFSMDSQFVNGTAFVMVPPVLDFLCSLIQFLLRVSDLDVSTWPFHLLVESFLSQIVCVNKSTKAFLISVMVFWISRRPPFGS